jgi:alpha-amylase
LFDPTEFRNQVKQHSERINLLFGQKPTVLRNTELIYSDDIAEMVYEMGYSKMITEGAKHILGWKSPNYVYRAASQPNMKLLLKNSRYSDDLAYRFSNYSWNEYPLTAEKFVGWIADTPPEEEVFNLFMNYEVLGNMQPSHTGIFEFMKALPRFAFQRGIGFSTPSEELENKKPIGEIIVPNNISWSDEERDVSAWLGNKLQQSALKSLYEIGERVRLCSDRRLKQDWLYLQSSDHFYYMSTKHFGSGNSNFSPYMSPYDAFNNYMNVLSDFIERVKDQYPDTVDNEELNALLTTIHNQEHEIKRLQKELKTVIGTNEELLVEKNEKEGVLKKLYKNIDR